MSRFGDIQIFLKRPDRANSSGRDLCDLSVTGSLYDSFHRYLGETTPRHNDYLFKSQKGQKPLNLSTVSNMINGWYEAADIKGCYGAISLRKTWEYNIKDNPYLNPTAGPSKTLFNPIETASVQKTIYNELFNAIVSGKVILYRGQD